MPMQSTNQALIDDIFGEDLDEELPMLQKRKRMTRKQKLESGLWYEGLTKTGRPRLLKRSKRDLERSKKLKCGVYSVSSTGRSKQKSKKELIALAENYCNQIHMLTNLV